MRISKFRAPMLDVTFIVRDVEKNAAMRIRPNPFGYGPLQVNRLFDVIGDARSVVCEKRDGCEGKAGD
jgi:hypothetical protein